MFSKLEKVISPKERAVMELPKPVLIPLKQTNSSFSQAFAIYLELYSCVYETATTAIINVRIFDGRRTPPSATVIFKDGLIASIRSNPAIASEPTNVNSS
jgi:hypothetical protein